MKISQIQLDTRSDWRAAVRRIRGGTQQRVIVLWPAKGCEASPRLVLGLMQRRSYRLGVPLGVVAGNRLARQEAERLGLPLFVNARHARDEEWGVRQPANLPAGGKRRPRVGELREQASKRRAAARE